MSKPTGNPRGRPRGPKKPGLSLKQRCDVLQKIILNDNAKDADRLTAIKTMTDLLSDKVQTTADGKQELVLSFNELKSDKKITTKPIEPENREKTLLETIEKKDEAVEIPKIIETSNASPIAFTFQIDKNLTDEEANRQEINE